MMYNNFTFSYMYEFKRTKSHVYLFDFVHLYKKCALGCMLGLVLVLALAL